MRIVIKTLPYVVFAIGLLFLFLGAKEGHESDTSAGILFIVGGVLWVLRSV